MAFVHVGGSTWGPVMLLDRLQERAALSQLLDAARSGRSGVLVMRGQRVEGEGVGGEVVVGDEELRVGNHHRHEPAGL